jgi:ornithine decarboxylase
LAGFEGMSSMDFFKHFTVLVSAPAFDPDDLEGVRVQQIVAAVEREGFEVVRARRIDDAAIAVQTDAAVGCVLVDWGKRGLDGKTAALIHMMRKRGLDMPIVILVRRKRLEDIPVEVLDFIDGYVFLAEETPEFIARGLISRLKQYAETLKTPFFGALVDYAEEGNQLWTCPGHNGGIFYNRSPIGRIFVQHLGEAVFRDDLDNSVLELGDLLTHEAPRCRRRKKLPPSSAPRRPISCSTARPPRTRSCCRRWSPRAISCFSIATTTRRPCMGRCFSVAPSRSFSRPIATPTA